MVCNTQDATEPGCASVYVDSKDFDRLDGLAGACLTADMTESGVESGNPTMDYDGEQCQLVEPVAIVGMAMRLPGGVRDSETFWDMLIHRRSGRCLVPQNRYNIDSWYGPGRAGHVASKYGYFLDDLDLGAMDTSFWSMTKQEVEALDPQQRLLLEVVYETFQNAGTKEWSGTNVGCYVGTFEGDWLEMDRKDSQTTHPYRLSGYGDYMAANRVSYEFGLQGPRYVLYICLMIGHSLLISDSSVTMRTACSSSLIGLHEACKALFSGECTSAIVGASNLILSPRTTVLMHEQGVMSATGSC